MYTVPVGGRIEQFLHDGFVDQEEPAVIWQVYIPIAMIEIIV